MSRIWWATISGLILGGVLFGMMQRGCESTADTTTAPFGSALDPIAMMAPTAPASRLPASVRHPVAPRVDVRSAFGPITSAIPRPKINVGATGVRPGSQQLNTISPQYSEFGNAVQRARQRDELRAQAQRARQARIQDANLQVQSAQAARLRATNQQQESLVTLGVASGGQYTALEGQSLIQSRLLQQIRREQRRESSDASGARSRGGGPNSPDEGGDASGPSGAGENPNSLAGAGAGAAVTRNSVPPSTTGAAGAAFPNAGTTVSNTDPNPTTPLDTTPIGDTSTPTVTPPPTTEPSDSVTPPPPPFVIPPPPTGPGNTDGAGSPPSDGPAVLARWAPVQTDTACDQSGTRTNDLFLGFRDQMNLQIVTSAAPLALRIDGGSFIQDPLGDNEQPSVGALAINSCVAFDTYLAIGEERNLLMPVMPDDPLNWGGSLNAVWSTPITTPFGVAGVQDSARFGDDRYYVRVGRFTATGNPDFVGGTLIVNALNLATFSFVTEVVTVDFVSEDWAVDGVGGPILSNLSFDSASAVGGLVTGATVTISSPAPDTGVEVILLSGSSLLSVPATVMIGPGQTSVRFNVTTSAVSAPNIATLNAVLNSVFLSASVTLQAPPTSSLEALTISPSIVRGGLAATGTVTLTSSAPTGGLVVNLSSDDLSIANVPANVLILEGDLQASFQILTAEVTAPKPLLIWAKSGDQIRTAPLTVTIASDLTGDGVVDGADLAQLLGLWNTSDPNADLNGDGVVDAADLAELLATFDSTTNATPFTGAVIARWIPIDIPAQCSDLVGQRSNDLYLGFETSPDAPVISSIPDTQLFMINGVVHQDPFGSNSPPSDFVTNLFPCVAYDSYLTLGGASPIFLPGTSLDPADWGSALTAAWFTTDFGGINIEQNPTKFGDSRFYLKIARITATQGVRIEGELTVDYAVDGVGQPTTSVPVLQCPVCWKSFDLNGDGVVDAGDVNFVMAMLGTNDQLTDLNSDGIVNAADLSLIINETANQKPAKKSTKKSGKKKLKKSAK